MITSPLTPRSPTCSTSPCQASANAIPSCAVSWPFALVDQLLQRIEANKNPCIECLLSKCWVCRWLCFHRLSVPVL
jgi:hypothetical protein